jgi:hypothetical protein
LHFSWDNVDAGLEGELKEFGLPENLAWVGSELGFTRDGAKRYRVREARVHLLKDSSGNAVCLSFLTKYGGGDAALAYFVPKGGMPQSIPIRWLPGGDNSLFRVLMCAADFGAGRELQNDEAVLRSDVVKRICAVVHDIRETAVNQDAPTPEHWDAHVERFMTLAELEDVFAVKAVVFDLDNTLIDTANLPVTIVDPVIRAVLELQAG